MSLFGKVFKKKPKKTVTISKFITDIESKIETLSLSDKMITKLEKKLGDFNAKLRHFNDRIEEFAKDRKQMEEISKRVIELVSLIYTMDIKINNLNKRFEDIKKAVPKDRTIKTPKVKKSKEIGQFELELSSFNNREKNKNVSEENL